TADDRVEFALTGRRREVRAELLQRLVGALGVGRRDPLAAARRLEGVQQLAVARALLRQQLAGLAALGGEADQQVFGGDVLVAQLAGARGGVGQHGEQL